MTRFTCTVITGDTCIMQLHDLLSKLCIRSKLSYKDGHLSYFYLVTRYNREANIYLLTVAVAAAITTDNNIVDVVVVIAIIIVVIDVVVVVVVVVIVIIIINCYC